MITYLMLDKKDITNVCGRITAKEVMDELGLKTEGQFRHFINNSEVFRNCYILVEDDHNHKKQENIFKTRLVLETKKGRRYYATADGKFYVIYKNGKKKYMKGFIKTSKNKKIYMVKLGPKDFNAKRLIARLFIRSYKETDAVILKDNNPRNVSIDNMIITDKRLYSKITGKKNTKNKEVGLYKNNELVRTFYSVREAGRKLYCSYQMVSDICNNRYKKKEFDLRWMQ